MASADIDVAYVAKLARLELTPGEVERFGAQLGALLEHVKTLEALPTAGVAATAQVIPSTSVMRDDVPRPSLPRELVLEGAPQREGSYFRVPSILGDRA
jgi:aspartyl-tRNA(Asn)/glutamyl-tRNA(Gln) amidotransferase subunit C